MAATDVKVVRLGDADLKAIIPPLVAGTKHKGQAGRIAVVGGSRDYTGAPYYAGISALSTGADLCHIFCAPQAAIPIKSYSPELIVHACLPGAPADEESPEAAGDSAAKSVVQWMPSVDCFVIGPGLGRDPATMNAAAAIVKAATAKGIPLVMDGDGLWLLTQQPSLVHGNRWAVLTPNAAEYPRLCRAVGIREDAPPSDLAKAFGNVTVLKKGKDDVITDGICQVVPEREGSPRRCGGQGDVLAGATGTFLAWAMAKRRETEQVGGDKKDDASPSIVAAVCSSQLTRQCAHRAYGRLRRATLTTAVIEEIGGAFEDVFGPP